MLVIRLIAFPGRGGNRWSFARNAQSVRISTLKVDVSVKLENGSVNVATRTGLLGDHGPLLVQRKSADCGQLVAAGELALPY